MTLGYVDDKQYKGNMATVGVDTSDTPPVWHIDCLYLSINGKVTGNSEGEPVFLGKPYFFLLHAFELSLSWIHLSDPPSRYRRYTDVVLQRYCGRLLFKCQKRQG